MARAIIYTNNAPRAIGTYSQAVRAGKTVYLSGQIPLVPESMEMVEGDMGAQIRRVFDNLSAVAEAAGGSLIENGRAGPDLRFPVQRKSRAAKLRRNTYGSTRCALLLPADPESHICDRSQRRVLRERAARLPFSRSEGT